MESFLRAHVCFNETILDCCCSADIWWNGMTYGGGGGGWVRNWTSQVGYFLLRFTPVRILNVYFFNLIPERLNLPLHHQNLVKIN